jgi:hypothetical protein
MKVTETVQLWLSRTDTNAVKDEILISCRCGLLANGRSGNQWD